MRKNKGISLIVLIITIIVIIILATAILVSVISNNPISEANKARYESDRDNMQAVFTNTVGKIMAENQGVVNVTAGQINTETTDVNETTGEVAYTVDNATVAANASGKIVFDKGTNDATTYYTGKKLPIYAAGETKWYVDSEGVLSLEVAGVKYGSGSGSGAEEAVTLAAGLYDENNTQVKTWQELLDEGIITVTDGVLMCTDYTIEDKLVIDESVTSIGDFAFVNTSSMSGCSNLIEVIMPKSIKSIGGMAFGMSGLKNITIPDSVKEIGEGPFFMCANLTTVSIQNGITSLSMNMFTRCTALTDVTIPNTVVFIDELAFKDCTSLTSVTIPDSVTSIAPEAFDTCTSLASIYIPESVTTISTLSFSNSPFYGCSSDLKIYCGASEAQSGWETYWNYYSNAGTLDVTYGVTRAEYEAIIAE